MCSLYYDKVFKRLRNYEGNVNKFSWPDIMVQQVYAGR